MEPEAETLLAQWEQPAEAVPARGGAGRLFLLAVPIAAALIGLAVWQRELNFGLAALGVLVAPFALRSQSRAGAPQVSVTNLRIVLGKREHLLSNLAGFWLDTSDGAVAINLETKKPGLLPTSFLYANGSADEARATMDQVLPELEPREKKLGDRLGTYFKL